MNTDLDRVIKETDVGQIEQLLSNITFAELDFEDLQKLGDSHFAKLFRLSQLTIEYLLYTQTYLEALTKSLDEHYKKSRQDTLKINEAIKQQRDTNRTLKQDI